MAQYKSNDKVTESSRVNLCHQLYAASTASDRCETEGKEFFASGLVWDVPKLAAKYKVTVQGKCWAFLLNRKQGSKKMACCGQHTLRRVSGGDLPPAHTFALTSVCRDAQRPCPGGAIAR